MEFNFDSNQYAQGKAAAYYSGRDFLDEETVREAVLREARKCNGLPHPPTQYVRAGKKRGQDKPTRGMMTSRVVKQLADEGLIHIVAGPSGGQWVVIA